MAELTTQDTPALPPMETLDAYLDAGRHLATMRKRLGFLIGDRLRQLDEKIVYARHYDRDSAGLQMIYERLAELQVEIARKHCGAEMARGDADVIASARWAARQAKDWTEADRLRGRLIEGGWHITDTTTGYELTQAR